MRGSFSFEPDFMRLLSAEELRKRSLRLLGYYVMVKEASRALEKLPHSVVFWKGREGTHSSASLRRRLPPTQSGSRLMLCQLITAE